MTEMPILDARQLAASVAERWLSTPLTRINDQVVRLRVMQDACAPWHSHADSDEAFLVFEGELVLEAENGPAVTVAPGQLHVVRSGTVHRARCTGRVVALVFDGLPVAPP